MRPELAILGALMGIGVAIGIPVLGKCWRHEGLRTWDWVSLVAGVLLTLCGVVPMAKWFYFSWRDHWRRPKP